MESRGKLLKKIIVLLGPTASGKSDMAIYLAQKFNGEIISADSRQIYRHANLTTGKVKPDRAGEIKRKIGPKNYSVLISKGVPHYLINIASLRTNYTVVKFQRDANYVINYIIKKNKLPIICGGTGFWIKALIDNIVFPEVKPNWKLRARLNKFSVQKLFSLLKKLDTKRAENIDSKNKVRLIRAIEICEAIGKVPTLPPFQEESWKGIKFLQIGIDLPKIKLRANIKKRLQKRLQAGMIKEVENLHKKYGVSWKRLENLGLEFRWIAYFLQRKISREEMEAKLYFDILHYAKRQMTWFKRDSRIKWLSDKKEVPMAVQKFIF